MNRDQAYEKLIDANIGLLSKTLEHSKHGKTLKAEFVRDDGAGGKYYGYMRGGKVHVIHTRGRGKWGSSLQSEQQLGVDEESMDDAPGAEANQSQDYGGNKVAHWREDASKIMGEAGGGSSERTGDDREVGAVESMGGGAVSSSDVAEKSAGMMTKPQTKLENVIARLAEAEAQYIRVKTGKSYQEAFQMAIDKAKQSFRAGILEKIRRLTGHDIIYDIKQNQFVYKRPMNGTVELSARDRAIVDKIVESFTEEANRIIKARTTAVRRAKGSDE
jgi:hypothetical protein